MRILLIFPAHKYRSGDPPLGIGSIGAIIKKHFPSYEVYIHSTTFTHPFARIFTLIKDIKPEIIGLSVDTLNYPNAIKIAKFAKQNRIFTIVGGPHITIMPNSFAGIADLAIIGEGENAIISVLQRFKSQDFEGIPGVVNLSSTPIDNLTKPELVEELDTLPFPLRPTSLMPQYIKNFMYFDSVDFSVRGTTMIVTRGCPYSCTYCQPTLRKIFGPKVRKRSPGLVREEIEFLKRKYAINAIFFHDDTLFFDTKWAYQLFEELAKTGIIWGCNSRIDNLDADLIKTAHQSGLRIVHLGIESFNSKIVNGVYKKNIPLEKAPEVINLLRSHGVNALGFFMFGAPTEGVAELANSIKFMTRSNLSEVSISITTPLPGTTLYDSFQPKSQQHIYDYYRGSKAQRKLPLWMLRITQIFAFFVFYLSKKHIWYIIRHLKSKTGRKRLVQKIRRYV